MKKKKPFLELYNRICKNGRLINRNGLCNEIIEVDGVLVDLQETLIFDMIAANISESRWAYWGYSTDEERNEKAVVTLSYSGNPLEIEFTPFRQTILLLCAAINGEL